MPAASRYPTLQELLDEASTSTRLTDFGPGDFRAGLEALLRSLTDDADLDPSTDAGVFSSVRRRLVNRLELEAWISDHPETMRTPIRGPIDINGLPRTGSTALSSMLSIDPQFRCLRLWEQVKPCPPPTPDSEATDPRRVQEAAGHAQAAPHVKAMYIYESEGAAEDSEVMGMAFHGQQYTLPVYGYHAWWRAADMTDTYAYHRRVVQVLGSCRPPDLWLFKSPHHKFHLEAIAASYPDVRFVMTHRDPLKVVPSYASLVSALMPTPRSERDLHRLGREVSDHLRIGMENAIAARQRLGEHRFIDVHHRDLVTDSVSTLKGVYDALDLEPWPTFELDVRNWQANNRTGARGEHRYTAEQFGLSASQIRADYDFYIRHFGINVEG